MKPRRNLYGIHNDFSGVGGGLRRGCILIRDDGVPCACTDVRCCAMMAFLALAEGLLATVKGGGVPNLIFVFSIHISTPLSNTASTEVIPQKLLETKILL